MLHIGHCNSFIYFPFFILSSHICNYSPYFSVNQDNSCCFPPLLFMFCSRLFLSLFISVDWFACEFWKSCVCFFSSCSIMQLVIKCLAFSFYNFFFPCHGNLCCPLAMNQHIFRCTRNIQLIQYQPLSVQTQFIISSNIVCTCHFCWYYLNSK